MPAPWRAAAGGGDSSARCQQLPNGHPGLHAGMWEHPQGQAEQQPGRPRRAPHRSRGTHRYSEMGAHQERGAAPAEECKPQEMGAAPEDGCSS